MLGSLLVPFVLERADFMQTAVIASSSGDPRGALNCALVEMIQALTCKPCIICTTVFTDELRNFSYCDRTCELTSVQGKFDIHWVSLERLQLRLSLRAQVNNCSSSISFTWKYLSFECVF